MHRVAHAFIGFLVAGLLTCPVSAAVVDTQPNGFAIQQVVRIAATPEQVYAALIKPALWWDSSHTFSGHASNLSIDARAGGCFCETLPNGGSTQHAVVVDAAPGETLRLRGPLGPFQGHGVDSALTFTLKAKDGGTELTLDNIIGGYMKGGWGQWPSAADAMLGAQMARLKTYLETGSPDPKS
jgi:uncharacterized protein YndB with AHSA1/START domain